MIDLRDTTFIIPVYVESEDRKINASITLAYLCKHLVTNIIVYEYGEMQQIPEIVKSIYRGSTQIDYVFEPMKTNIFHRTKFLNTMLMRTTTPIVVNYDVDVLLRPEVYEIAAESIRNGMDLVYPYFWGNSQHQVNYLGRKIVAKQLALDELTPHVNYGTTRSEYGHCQFFNTKSYIEGGMENEGFVSYAPEDQERGYRFKALGYNVGWDESETHYVYHLEHSRGPNSSGHNPMMSSNNKLFELIKSLNPEQLRAYYNAKIKEMT